MTIIAAADGSALGNPGPAGWAWYIDDSRWRCGGWKRGTNNQGELAAVLDLLRQTAHTAEPLHVLCDSQYVINSITKWMAGWKRKGWKKADGKPVLNVEVMKALDQAMQGRSVTFEWVKGHAGHELNEKADVLANGASKAHASGKLPEAGPGFPGATAVGAGDDPSAPPANAGGQSASADGSRQSTSGNPTTSPSQSTASASSSPASTSATSPCAAEPDLFSFDDDGSTADVRPVPAVDLVAGLEQALLTGTVQSDRAHLTAMLDPSWRHISPGGELRELDDALAEVGRQSTGDQRTVELIEARELGADVVLLVWRENPEARSPQGSILRSSVWHRTDGAWRQVFHQGTHES